jgi:hypothetical protein
MLPCTGRAPYWTAPLLWTLAAVNAIGLDCYIREETNDKARC